MPKEHKITPRFKRIGALQVFDIPKGYVVLRLERHAGDGTMSLICKRVSLAKKKATAKAK